MTYREQRDRKIHRFGIDGGAACGTTERPIQISISGVTVTCPECLRLDKPISREQALAAIHATAAPATKVAP